MYQPFSKTVYVASLVGTWQPGHAGTFSDVSSHLWHSSSLLSVCPFSHLIIEYRTIFGGIKPDNLSECELVSESRH